MAGLPVLPEGRSPAVIDLPSRAIATGRDATSTFRLQLSRDDDGGASFHVTGSVPITSGDTYRIVGADGHVVAFKSTDNPASQPPNFAGDVFTQVLCANSRRSSHRYGPIDYQITIDPQCTLEALQRIEIVTPRANLVEVRHTRTIPSAYRVIAGVSLFAGLTPLLIGGGIALMVLESDHRVGYSIGIPLVALGALLGWYKIRVLFTPDRTTVAYP